MRKFQSISRAGSPWKIAGNFFESTLTECGCRVSRSTGDGRHVRVAVGERDCAIQQARLRLDADVLAADHTTMKTELSRSSRSFPGFERQLANGSVGLPRAGPAQITTRQTQLTRFIPAPDVEIAGFAQSTAVPTAGCYLDDSHSAQRFYLFGLIN